MSKQKNSTPNTPAATTPASTPTTAVASAKIPTSWTKTLSSGNDQFQVIVMAGKNGVSAYGVYVPRDEQKKPIKADRQRGASKTFNGPTAMADAITYGKALVDAQVKAGWQLPQPLNLGKGVTPKPDAFSITSLPAPRKAQAPAQAQA
jgi:hypothetical protein